MEALFVHTIPLSIKAAIVIPFMLLLRFLIRKQPKIYTYPLWIMVFLGLVFDFNITVPIEKAIINPIAAIQENAVNSYTGFINKPYGDVNIHYENSAEYKDAKAYGAATHTDRETGIKYVVTEKDSLLPRTTVFKKVFPAFYLAWAFVAVNIWLWFLKCTFKIDDSLVNLKHYKENIYFTDNIPSPFVYGIFRPKIYIPHHLENRDINYILQHEKMHIRHRDNIIKPVCFLIAALHWFNPLVCLCYRLLCIDIEMACDEAVLNRLGQDNKKAYSLRLLDYASGKYSNYAITIMFGESHTEKRIKNILGYKKTTAIMAVVLTAFIIMGCIAPVITTAASEKANGLTFAQQLEQVATTDHIQYQYRTMVFGTETADYWGNTAADGSSFAALHGNPSAMEKVAVHNQVVGSRVDDHPDGMFYYFLFLTGKNDTFTNHYRFLNGESRGGGGGVISRNYPDRVATKVVSADYLGDNLYYEVFYSTEKYSGYGENKHTPQLTIKKTCKTEKTPTEYLVGAFNLVQDYNDPIKYVTEVYYLSADKVGEDVSSVRFLNENLGFLSHSKDGYTALPQAMITLDGGAAWLDLDFSDIVLTEKFTAYRSAFIELYGETIEIYLDVQYPDGSYSAEKQHPYRLISYDCGKTWGGYLMNEAGAPVLATNIMPAAIK